MTNKIVCERRYDEGLRTFQNGTIGTIRTIDAGGAKLVLECDKQDGIFYLPKKCFYDDGSEIKSEEGEISGYRIRKLTPRECFRLMGFSDADFEKAQEAGTSNTQLYKQAGNSIVVDVLYYIYVELYKAMPYLFDNLKVGSYFSGIGAFEKGLDRLFEDVNAGNI